MTLPKTWRLAGVVLRVVSPSGLFQPWIRMRGDTKEWKANATLNDIHEALQQQAPPVRSDGKREDAYCGDFLRDVTIECRRCGTVQQRFAVGAKELDQPIAQLFLEHSTVAFNLAIDAPSA